MKIKATKGRKAIITEVKDATYVEAARWGKYRWWRYVLGLTIILFSWLIVGSVGSAIVAFALDGSEGFAAFRRADLAALGSVGSFLVIMAGFPFFLAGILLAVSFVHRRPLQTLITAREKISWRRVGHGFVAWFVPYCLIGGLGQYLFYPDTFSFNSDLVTFALFVPIALVITAIQSTTEELFFRGYIVQGASIVWTNRVFLAIMPAVIFTLPHLLNPEAIAGGWLTVFVTYFLVPGLLWTVVSLIDGTTELAIGVHFANNIGGILVINAAGTVVTTPALFTVSEYHATYGALSVLVAIPVFLAIAYKVFKREEAPQPVSPERSDWSSMISSVRKTISKCAKGVIIKSKVSSNHPQKLGKSPAASSVQPNKVSRPGWLEIAVGLIVFAIVGFGVGSQLKRLGLDPVSYGLVFTSLSGIAGIAGFAAAALLRIRSLNAFGVRPVSKRWLLIAVGVGLVAFVLKGLAVLGWIQITGNTNNVQGVYAEGGSGGVLSLVLATLFLGIVTPLGEELLFRGVVANALLRYGPFIGVAGSTVIFALGHGINIVFPAAVVAGLATAEVFRRSGSVWTAVVVHVVFNLPTIPVMVAAGMG